MMETSGRTNRAHDMRICRMMETSGRTNRAHDMRMGENILNFSASSNDKLSRKSLIHLLFGDSY